MKPIRPVSRNSFGGFGNRFRQAAEAVNNPGMQPQQASPGLSALPQAEIQRLQQMQGMLQGAPIGNRAQVAQMPAAQMPTAQTGATQVTPPSFAQQMGAMGGVGTGLQQMLGNKPAGMKKGGAVKKKASSKTYKSGGSVSSASKRADGCAIKGKTKGKMV